MPRLLLPASLTLLFSPLMMMHKPHFPEIMTETLGGGYGRRERELGVWGLRETWVCEWGQVESERMRAQRHRSIWGRQGVQEYKTGAFSRFLPL